ncbi:MAG: hypothetical protein Q8K98_08330 [Bacteroidota bacterium]|nr:hypothetical protein [Bacteroidota bacterium]
MPNATIEGFECTLFYDYDCHRDHILNQLSDNGKIDWLEKRMRMIFLDPLKKIYDRTSVAHNELNVQASGAPMTPMLMTFSLLMNGIEALGSFLIIPSSSDRKKNYRRFNDFMTRYLPDWTVQIAAPHHGNRKLSDVLWEKYRNGLAHSFAILEAGIDDVPGNGKTMIKDNVLQVDGWKFFADLVSAVDRMFEEVRNLPTARATFLQRFEDVYHC